VPNQPPSITEAIAIARLEAMRPTWGVSKQFFESHRPAVEAGEPVIAALDQVTAPEAVFVFMPVVEEPYHFFVRVEGSASGPRITFTGYCPAYRVQLVIVSSELTAEAVSALIGLTPSEVRVKGSPILNGPRTYPEHQWRLEPSPRTPGFLEYKLATLLAIATPQGERIASLPSTCRVEVSVVSRQWHAWPEGLHLTAANIAAIRHLRASFDLDLYISGPREPAT
jgi:hypothetical protein